MATKTISRCGVCGYPITAEYEGQTVTCAMCGSVNEAISQGVVISTPVFVGVLAFLGGMLLGPTIIASTSGGKRWLEEQARGR